MRKVTLPLVPALLLGAAVVLTGCPKSELDDKPSATVNEPAEEKADEGEKKADEAKPAKKADEPAKKADEAKPDEPAKPAATGETLHADKARSVIGFVGAKVTGDHKGSFKEFSGKTTIAGGKATSVSFTVQMASVESDAAKLTGHLKSPDFFDVAKFPTSTFASTSIKEGAEGGTHTITGDLTLHGVTKSITFPAQLRVGEGESKGKASFKINRKDFGIVYPGMPDDLIKDEVLLNLDLVFTP